MLVGGGELHDRWSSLVGVSEPLGRGIQRFTGITQAMVDEAPPPADGAPGAGRAAARPAAGGAQRALRRRCPQAGVRARRAGVAGPAGAVHGRARAPAGAVAAAPRPRLARRRARDRGRARPTARCPTRRPARACCARCCRACRANARTIGEALALVRARASRRSHAPVGANRGRATSGRTCPRCPRTRASTSSATPTGARCTSASRSACARARERTSRRPSTWTGEAEHVDYQPTESELGALVLENRLIKALKPPGNTLLKKDADGYVYLRCRLDIPFPILEVAREPAAGHAVCIGPVRGRGAAAELVEQLNSLFGLRHCGRSPDAPPAPVGLRADGPLPVAVPRRPRSEPLPRAPRRGAAACSRSTARRRCSPTSTRRCARRPPPSSATSARPGCAAVPAPPRVAARAARRRAARRPRGRARSCCAAPGGARAGRRVLDRRRPGRRLGPAAARLGRARWPAPTPRSPPPRLRLPAAGCRRTSSTRRGSSASGSPPTRTRRACWSSSRGADRAALAALTASLAGDRPRRAPRAARATALVHRWRDRSRRRSQVVGDDVRDARRP